MNLYNIFNGISIASKIYEIFRPNLVKNCVFEKSYITKTIQYI